MVDEEESGESVEMRARGLLLSTGNSSPSSLRLSCFNNAEKKIHKDGQWWDAGILAHSRRPSTTSGRSKWVSGNFSGEDVGGEAMGVQRKSTLLGH